MEGIGLFVGVLYDVSGCISDRNMVESRQYRVTIENIFAAQPAADVLTLVVCVCSVRHMKELVSRKMDAGR